MLLVFAQFDSIVRRHTHQNPKEDQWQTEFIRNTRHSDLCCFLIEGNAV